MSAIPSVPAAAVEKAENPKPKRQPVSDEEALNIAFNELSALCRKHSGRGADVAHALDAQGRFQVFLTGVERVEPPGSPTVTLRFKAPTPAPAMPTPMRLPQIPK